MLAHFVERPAAATARSAVGWMRRLVSSLLL